MEFTGESFSLPSQALQAQYFKRFDRICGEIRDAESRVCGGPGPPRWFLVYSSLFSAGRSAELGR